MVTRKSIDYLTDLEFPISIKYVNSAVLIRNFFVIAEETFMLLGILLFACDADIWHDTLHTGSWDGFIKSGNLASNL